MWQAETKTNIKSYAKRDSATSGSAASSANGERRRKVWCCILAREKNKGRGCRPETKTNTDTTQNDTARTSATRNKNRTAAHTKPRTGGCRAKRDGNRLKSPKRTESEHACEDKESKESDSPSVPESNLIENTQQCCRCRLRADRRRQEKNNR